MNGTGRKTPWHTCCTRSPLRWHPCPAESSIGCQKSAAAKQTVFGFSLVRRLRRAVAIGIRRESLYETAIRVYAVYGKTIF